MMLNKITKLLFSLFLVATPVVSSAIDVMAEESIKAEITVTSNTDTKAVIEYSGDMPEPSSKEISISANKKANFEIAVYDPGTYVYTVRQAGTDKDSKLDKSVYTVSLFVTIDAAGELHYEVYASKNGSRDKTSVITFTNDTAKPTPTPTPTVSPNNGRSSDKDTANTESAGLYYLLAFYAVSVCIIVGKVIVAYRQDDGDD